MLYLVLVWLHVLAAAVALGTNVTYSVWIARARSNASVLPFTMATVKILDDRVANPAYGIVAITGVLLVWLGPFAFTTPWVLSSIVLFIAVGAIGFLVYTPILRRQVALAAAGQAATAEYRQLAARNGAVGSLLGVLVVAIVFLMVVKPALWG